MEEAPEVSAVFNSLIQSLDLPNGLDQKTMQLIGIKASQENVLAVYAHVPIAKQAGAYQGGNQECHSADIDRMRCVWCVVLPYPRARGV
jgi:alkylhydroperoxidase/carboxymuconolactone decarboxylase family protein YurZ